MRQIRLHHSLWLLACVLGWTIAMPFSAEASCGSTSCFLTIPNQPTSQPKGVARVDLNYSYIPQTGPQNRVAAVDVEGQRQILGEHQEFQTINHLMQMIVNYGVTDAFTVQLLVPMLFRDHDHRIEVGEEPESDANNIGRGVFENFDTAGLGDIRLMGRYAILPTLRSLVVLSAGVDFPTGNFEARNNEGKIQEPTLQNGRGDFGVVGQIYQAYELIPHRLTQFASYTYQHTFENKFQYQFGDTHILNAGLNFLVNSTITLSGQINYTYRVHDTFAGNLEQAGPVGASAEPTVLSSLVLDRPVRNTGFTNLMFSPGIILNLGDNTRFYFFAQAPLVQDYNGGLEQGVSYLTGFARFFQIGT
ncbi:MAG: hypothetical protein D6690_05115 [Nitrospirae bacterium]|nr:MAG: hypothetical protein D6690_05115 [Nitrospirota bacterium]